jgi:hypothetical protein
VLVRNTSTYYSIQTLAVADVFEIMLVTSGKMPVIPIDDRELSANLACSN